MRTNPASLTYSQALATFTKAQEGLRLRAYNDGFGTWTIGYGHTMHVHAVDEITEAQAERYFIGDMSHAQLEVTHQVEVGLSQGEFDCMCDFVFNVGGAAFGRSDVLRAINAQNYASVPGALYGWSRAGSKFNTDLYNRRKASVAQFWQQPT